MKMKNTKKEESEIHDETRPDYDGLSGHFIIDKEKSSPVKDFIYGNRYFLAFLAMIIIGLIIIGVANLLTKKTDDAIIGQKDYELNQLIEIGN